MLIRGLKRLVFSLAILLIMVLIAATVYRDRLPRWGAQPGLVPSLHHDDNASGPRFSQGLAGSENDLRAPQVDMTRYREVFSVSSASRAYFLVDFDGHQAINPSILPHPKLPNTWIIVAQKRRLPGDETGVHVELVCNAVFRADGVLACVEPAAVLPIAPTQGDDAMCEGDVAYFRLNEGPHDARVFFGPWAPYTIYGSNAVHTCFSQWMLDFRLLVDWGFEFYHEDTFRQATELQRPVPYGVVEKNWFVFWDAAGALYAHYDIAPRRAFARLSADGSVGEDLAPLAAAAGDDRCMQAHLPRLESELESLHQATNSLAITLCRRADPTCQETEDNTFILTIFHHKSFYQFHSVYEPYVMLFRRSAPFALYGLSTKPLWIHGRRRPGEWEEDLAAARWALPTTEEAPPVPPEAYSEMMFMTSVTWKNHGLKYHGYLDDIVFLGFGIEDKQTGGIDVLAGDLLADIRLC